ncbi:MAG: hypothetical protein ACYDD4_05310 [Acidimicrobiales bacterium]
MAVGRYLDATGATDPLADIWTGGSAWAATLPIFTPLDGDSFDSVSCSSSAFCVAVGDNQTDPPAPLAEIWNGRTWSSSELVSPKAIGDRWLYGVSCTATTFCMAVGAAGADGWAEMWNGRSWSAEPLLSHTRSTVVLSAVSCPSSTYCVAVGHAAPVMSTQFPVAARLSGRSWHMIKTSAPLNAFNDLTALSCTRAGSCAAIGYYGVANNYHDPEGNYSELGNFDAGG